MVDVVVQLNVGTPAPVELDDNTPTETLFVAFPIPLVDERKLIVTDIFGAGKFKNSWNVEFKLFVWENNFEEFELVAKGVEADKVVNAGSVNVLVVTAVGVVVVVVIVLGFEMVDNEAAEGFSSDSTSKNSDKVFSFTTTAVFPIVSILYERFCIEY